MQRLVYAPKVQAWVKTDTGIVDLSPYLTKGEVNRKIDQISGTTLNFRNPRKIFTSPAVIHPMDPIVIAMTRLHGRPIQVFTGYVDASPYESLYPGEVSLEASCTLKRLQHTYWDPALPFTQGYLKQFGWVPNQALGGLVNLDTLKAPMTKQLPLTDGSIGNLLFNVLQEPGGWSPDDIFIEELPPTILPLVQRMFDSWKSVNEEEWKGFEDFLTQLIGTEALGLALGGGGAGVAAGLLPPGGGETIRASVFGYANDEGGKPACAGQNGVPNRGSSHDLFGGMAYADLGGALGVPCGQAMRVTYGNRSIIAYKTDTGPAYGGNRKMDIWVDAAKALSLPKPYGLYTVKIERLTSAQVRDLAKSK